MQYLLLLVPGFPKDGRVGQFSRRHPLILPINVTRGARESCSTLFFWFRALRKTAGSDNSRGDISYSSRQRNPRARESCSTLFFLVPGFPKDGRVGQFSRRHIMIKCQDNFGKIKHLYHFYHLSVHSQVINVYLDGGPQSLYFITS